MFKVVRVVSFIIAYIGFVFYCFHKFHILLFDVLIFLILPKAYGYARNRAFLGEKITRIDIYIYTRGVLRQSLGATIVTSESYICL